MVNTSSPSHRLREVIAYHGWGFDASCWHDWQIQFEQAGWRFQAFDRGYWRQSVSPTFNPNAEIKLLMVHSYGLHLCPVEQFQRANRIVIFCSFAQFHPTSEPLKRRSQKILQQMIDQFMIDPQRVLYNFQTKCYHPCTRQGTLSANFDSDLLLHDLNDLQTATMDLALLRTIPQILVLQGNQDQIVPAASSAELVNQLFSNEPKDEPFNAAENQFVNANHRVEMAGHALPFTHLNCCWSKLHHRLEDRIPYER